MFLKLIKHFNNYDSLDADTEQILNTSYYSDTLQAAKKDATPVVSNAPLSKVDDKQPIEKSHVARMYMQNQMILSADNLNRNTFCLDLYKESGIDCPNDSFAWINKS